MNMIKHISKPILGALVCFFVSVFLLNSAVYAYQFYYKNNPNGENQCLANSGGRSHLHSIQFACNRAYHGDGGPQNACASWIGSASDSTNNDIYISVPKGTATATLSLYGMCTDNPNTSAKMQIKWDGGSLSGGDNFTRGAPWGNMTARTIYLDVAKFKVAAATQPYGWITKNGTSTTYHLGVGLIRQHGGTSSHDWDIAFIHLTEGEVEKPVQNLCQAWMPSSYPASNANSGRTTIVVKARNTAGRFGGTLSGAWHHDNPEGNSPAGEVGPIYAMPTDVIQWHSCYYPGVQATAFTEVSDINGIMVNGGANGSGSYEPHESLVYRDTAAGCMGYYPVVGYKQLYQGYREKVGEWQNRYQVGTALGSASGGDYGPGQYAWRSDFERDGNRGMGTRKRSDVGNILTQIGITGAPKAASISSRTPQHTVHEWQDRYDYSCDPYGVNKILNPMYVDPHNCLNPNGPFWDPYDCPGDNHFANAIKPASVDTGKATDKARVIIPYNFKLDTGVEVATNEIYAGEYGMTVTRAWVRVGTKYNNLTIADYATVVPKAEVALFAYVSTHNDGGGGGSVTTNASCDMIDGKQCVEIKRVSFTDLNAGGNLSGSTDDVPGMSGTYNVFDAAAGDYMCFVAAVSPYTSGADDATGDYAGDGQWKFGYPACQIITKKPSFQVWGDSLYSVGSINTSVGEKLNIYNSYFTSKSNLEKNGVRFKATGGGSTKIYFGSWVEESLMLRDGLTGTVASGAAMGLNSNYAGVGASGAFCSTRSPLSFANNCRDGAGGPSGVGGEMVGRSGINSLVANREELIDYWIGSGTYKGSCGNVWGGTCQVLESANNKDIYYVSGGNLTVGGNIPQNTTYLVKATGTVTINNLRYNNGVYNSIGAIPKVIIYAQNFNIACGVSEVDAILITAPGGHTDTCAGGGDVNSSARSVQLKIFGTVMTDSITLGRTYGAAANQGGRTDPYGTPSDGAAAEIFDYDSTILMWSEFMSGSGESDTLNTTYQHELAPRY